MDTTPTGTIAVSEVVEANDKATSSAAHCRQLVDLPFALAQQRAEGTLNVWSEPYTFTRIPWLFNLRTDPCEKATITSNTYWDWYLDRAFLMLPAAEYVGKFLASFQEYPPRQKAASFTIDQVLEQLVPPGQ